MEKSQINHHVFGITAQEGRPIALKSLTKKENKDNLNPAQNYVVSRVNWPGGGLHAWPVLSGISGSKLEGI